MSTVYNISHVTIISYYLGTPSFCYYAIKYTVSLGVLVAGRENNQPCVGVGCGRACPKAGRWGPQGHELATTGSVMEVTPYPTPASTCRLGNA